MPHRTAKQPIILGITGDHNCGKTTVAQLLEAHADARAMAFSDGIYAEVAKAFGCCILDLASRLSKTQPQRLLALQNCTDKDFVQCVQAHAEGDLQTPRSPLQILEWWGSEYRRTQAPDYWLEYVRSRIAYLRMHSCRRPIVLADVYKRNEAEMIRNMGGTIWRIKRPGHEQRTTHATSTEHLQIQADLTLHNIADVGHLQHLVLTHWHELKRHCQPAAGTSS
ncbi:hypothetical protein [Comamonas avium]|uniref:Deoxynucleotide monophosphate kinase n=1 Tax=Comamonas avium TaxID=2762231 RepID=A0ABR8SDE0_9BURK|nr:hypothetical protein [Comamonas avium]MBD7961511.1 hypothetical protein [Comamonas avium]